MHVLIAGCGWLGQAVARHLLARGDRVTGVRRDPGRAAALAALGIQPLALDLAAPGAAARLPEDVDAILALQAAQGSEEVAYREAYLEVHQTLLQAAQRMPLRALVHSGSTGVFGQRNGAWVDETTPPLPRSSTAHILVQAESLLLGAAARGLSCRVVRLSGLYGPGRTGLVERVRTGILALGPGDGAWMNFCHQEDAARTLVAVLDRGRDGAVYHATDACPMRRREVVALVASRLGAPVPHATLAPTPGGPNRRVSGERTRQELGFRLAFPSLREGLAVP